MKKRILFGCYEVPGYGGANTASYKLFELMQNDGIDAWYVNIIRDRDIDYFKYVFGEKTGNPKCLDNVRNCVVTGDLFRIHPELEDLIRKISPDISIGIGYIPAFLMKRAAPRRDLIYITAGCNQAMQYIADGRTRDAVSLSRAMENEARVFECSRSREKEAVESSDLIITHSDSTSSHYRRFFPSYRGKIYSDVIWFAEWICKDALAYSDLKRPFHDRDIDALFVASTWTRSEKNYEFVKKIISRRKNASIHIVGETEQKVSGAEYHGLLADRKDLFTLLGRAKAVVCPSRYDAAPGILFEASAMGCNLIASKNCGNWQICNEELLVDPFSLDGFMEKIEFSLRRKLGDNMSYFLEKRSYEELREVISVF